MTKLLTSIASTGRLALLFGGSLFACLATQSARGQIFDPWQTNVGYGQLTAALGSSTPSGDGVPIAQIEPTEPGGKYYVFLDSPDLQALSPVRPVALVPDDGSGAAGNGNSGHATNVVGRYIYGNYFGLARGADDVTLYEAGDWVNNKLLAGINMAPNNNNGDFDFSVQNNSWVSTSQSPLSADLQTLRHYDWAIDEFDVTVLVGANNNEGAIPNQAHPRLLSHSYNALTVGRTDGKHSHGTGGDGQTSSDYFAGRIKPDLVAPGPLTSTTTGMVSSAAAILHDRADDLSALNLASKNEAMKAILLAGATKHNNIPILNQLNEKIADGTTLANWGRTAQHPLDDVYGAGQLNVWNSYRILDGGRHVGGAGAPGLAESYGWDYQDLKESSATSMKYNFVVPTGTVASDLSIILSWNATVKDPIGWSHDNTDVSLANLNLALTASNGGVLPVGVYASGDAVSFASTSTVDNVEHLWIPGTLVAGTYTLTVSALNSSLQPTAIDWDYGVAWRMNTDRLVDSADFDGDGFVDGSDLITWQQNLGKLVNATLAQGDANGDGAVDAADLMVFNAQITPAEVIAAAQQARAAISAIPEPATAGLAACAAGLFAAAARRMRSRR